MDTHTLASQDLIRKAVIEVAQLHENELLVVIEMVDTLKKQRVRPNRASAEEILTCAKARAAETSHLSREELMKKFSDTLDSIRAESVAKGTALEGEWESD